MISLETINDLASVWSSWAVGSLWHATLGLTILALVWFVVRKSVSPQFGYLLFLLILVSVTFPLRITLPSWVARWSPTLAATEFVPQPWSGADPVDVTDGPDPCEIESLRVSVARDTRTLQLEEDGAAAAAAAGATARSTRGQLMRSRVGRTDWSLATLLMPCWILVV